MSNLGLDLALPWLLEVLVRKRQSLDDSAGEWTVRQRKWVDAGFGR